MEGEVTVSQNYVQNARDGFDGILNDFRNIDNAQSFFKQESNILKNIDICGDNIKLAIENDPNLNDRFKRVYVTDVNEMVIQTRKEIKNIILKRKRDLWNWSRADEVFDSLLRSRIVPAFIRERCYTMSKARGDILITRWLRPLFTKDSKLRRFIVWITILSVLSFIGYNAYHHLPPRTDTRTDRFLHSNLVVENVLLAKPASISQLEDMLTNPWVDWTSQDIKHGYKTFVVNERALNMTIPTLAELFSTHYANTSCASAPLMGIPITAVYCNDKLYLSPHIVAKTGTSKRASPTGPLVEVGKRMGLGKMFSSIPIPKEAQVMYFTEHGSSIVEVLSGNDLICIMTSLLPHNPQF